ncbi:transmembrane protein [Cyclospora cayetanensis]|uniref:Transmembrane protein n=1 Tax=Cyclospora cayetanensis TaxID=88456 RepID=A0A1D3D8I1_9EIME|nr:transmembrane protein [Cyclospora cayetanensis]
MMTGDIFGDGQQVQQAISWSHFAQLCTVCLYVLQQVGLLYHIAVYSVSLLFLAAADIVLLLMLLLGGSSEYAAMEGGTCWVVYSWALSVKYLVYFFVIYSGGGPQYGVVFEGPTGGVLEVGLLFSLGAGIYALLAFRASDTLFGGITHFSLDAMLHTDAVTHVVIDIIDGVSAFYAYSILPEAIYEQTSWLHLLAGILVPLALFLHGYSFPSAGGGAQGMAFGRSAALQAGGPSKDLGDMQTMRKHAAIVGIFFVDLPLLGLRLITWAYYPTCDSFSPFLFKNICFIPIQLARLRQCAVAERQRAKGEEGLLDGGNGGAYSSALRELPTKGSPLPRSSAAVMALEDMADRELPALPREEEASSKRRRVGAIGSAYNKEARRDREGPPYKPLKARAQPEAAAGSDTGYHGHQEGAQKRKSTAEGALKGLAFWRRQQHTKELARTESTEESFLDYDASLSRLVAVCRSASQTARRLPTPGFTVRRIFQRLLYAFRQLGSRHSAAVLLSSSFPVTFLQSVRLSFPFMASWICRLALTSTVFFFYSDYESFPVRLFTIDVMASGKFTWDALMIETRICLILIAAHGVILFFLFFLSAPLLDCLFTCCLTTVRLLSFYLALLTFRDFGVFADFLQLNSSNSVPSIGSYCLCIFAIEPLSFCGPCERLLPPSPLSPFHARSSKNGGSLSFPALCCLQLLGILVSLYPFISVLLGRETLTDVIPPPTSSRKASKTLEAAHGRPEMDFALPPAGAAHLLFLLRLCVVVPVQNLCCVEVDEQPRADEVEIISTASLMLFISCRAMTAPISMHQLLIGPNLIKAVR